MTSTLKINDQILEKKRIVFPLLRKGISMLLARSPFRLKRLIEEANPKTSNQILT
jgi:hypothetical protein